nr:hypothetical protein [uncultured Flavobacterium sp.]
MKTIFYSLVVLFFISSCGPHRMGCGARGICKSHLHQQPIKIKKSDIVWLN